MNTTDVWEDMNMICKYIDEVHTYTIGCGLHNMSIYIRRYSFDAPPNNWLVTLKHRTKSPDSTDESVSFPTNGNSSRIRYMTRIDSVLLKRKYIGGIIIVIVIVISKLLKRYSKAKRTRAPAYSRALRRIKGGFPKGGQEKLRSEFQSTRRGQSSC